MYKGYKDTDASIVQVRATDAVFQNFMHRFEWGHGSSKLNIFLIIAKVYKFKYLGLEQNGVYLQ
jgi:hypothetical protein